MSFKVKLGVGLGVILAIFACISALNQVKLKTMQKSVVDLFRGDIFALELMSDVRPTISQFKHLEKDLVLAVEDPLKFKKMEKKLLEEVGEINDFLDLMFEDEHLNNKQKDMIKKIKVGFNQYVSLIKELILKASEKEYSITQMKGNLMLLIKNFLQ